MTSIANLFSNFDDLTKKKTVTDSATAYTKHKYYSNAPTPALSQGDKFKYYQTKIKNNLVKRAEQLSGKEGFTVGGVNLNQLNLSPNGLTEQSKEIITSNNYSSQQQTISNLQQQYQTTLTQYENLVAEISGNVSGYVSRVSSSNTYLGKNISFTTGETAYVTQQGVVKLYPSNTIFTSTAGLNGCPASNNVTPVSLPWITSYNSPGVTIPTTPPLVTGTPMVSGQSCGNEGSNIYINNMVQDPSSSFVGCYADNVSSPLMTFIGGAPSSTSTTGTYTYEMCQKAAVQSGYQYFALQNVTDSSSVGFCAVTNNLTTATSLGPGLIPSQQQTLWSSNTSSSGTGSTALLSTTGSLSVLNSAGQAVFNTPNSNANPSNYLGCYGDGPNRAMTLYNNGAQQYNNSQCQQIAQQNGASYYGLQNSTSGTTAQCAFSSDWGQTSEYGVAGNCTQISDGSYSGGGYSNAVYNTTAPTSNYFLLLSDSGNMVVYRGTGPNDNQGVIWQSSTTANQANPAFAAANGKYGQNWIPQGSTLAAGDFIGSPNGYVALIMQTNGTLVLNTFSMVSNCSTMADNNTGGGVGANALYNIGQVGVQGNMGNIAYIDQNSQLHAYPSSNIKYKNSYVKINGTDSPGNDISGAAYGNATVSQCETTCNANSNCAGFSFSNATNTCYPKTNSMYPNGESQINSNVDLYMRNAIPSTTPVGVPNKTNNTNSIMYQNYPSGGALASQYGLANATSTQQAELSTLQTQLNSLTNQINELTNQFGEGSQNAATQMSNNVTGVGEYLSDLTKTNQKIQNYSSGMDNILNDSDIVVLQKNYDYLFWSILAAGSVLVAMNIVKN